MEITRTPNTNGTVDTCTLEDGYGFQAQVHNFTRRGIVFDVSLGETEDGTFANVKATFPDGTEETDRFEAYDGNLVKALARDFVSVVAFGTADDRRPRYGTPEWEREEAAWEAREMEDEFHGR